MSSPHYRVAILGCPSRPDVAWTRENLSTLRSLGFNVLQLNIAWGSRPADEPLNLEDLVELSCEQTAQFPQPVPLRSDPSPRRREERRKALRERIALATEEGFRTLFHFGAPFNAHMTYGDNPPNCLSDPRVTRRYELLLELFTADFLGIDDLLLYTYDQDAWLCSEFGECPRCSGVPLVQRLVPFLEKVAATWQRLSPNGRLWWEPWELSAGQTLQCLSTIDPAGFGLMLHSNAAEVMVALPVDRFVHNACTLAASRGIPTVLEGFLGAATEEVEPYTQLQTPLATLRHVRGLLNIPDAVGIKEYYGLLPDQVDLNLRATSLLLQGSSLSDEAVLERLAAEYGAAATRIVDFWRLTSEGMELFPWDASWWIREVGRSNPEHALTAAYLRGQQAHTASWESTRRAIFMKTDNTEPDPWLLEDVELRLDLTAARFSAALELGHRLAPEIPSTLAPSFQAGLSELHEFRRRVLAYVYHIRETQLAQHLRNALHRGTDSEALLKKLLATMEADLANMGTSEPLSAALLKLKRDLPAFLATYFLPTPEIRHSHGDFSVTSR